MSLRPSARPPSSQRRSPDLDSAEARTFVDKATSHPQNTSKTNEEGKGAFQTSSATDTISSRKEQLRPLTLRIPDRLHNNLLFIAENGSKSMNQFVIDVLTPAVELQLEKIARRKELGLD